MYSEKMGAEVAEGRIAVQSVERLVRPVLRTKDDKVLRQPAHDGIQRRPADSVGKLRSRLRKS